MPSLKYRSALFQPLCATWFWFPWTKWMNGLVVRAQPVLHNVTPLGLLQQTVVLFFNSPTSYYLTIP